jgi:hypothetical protein
MHFSIQNILLCAGGNVLVVVLCEIWFFAMLYILKKSWHMMRMKILILYNLVRTCIWVWKKLYDHEIFLNGLRIDNPQNIVCSEIHVAFIVCKPFFVKPPV